MKRPTTKAKTIDLKKDKLILGGLALLAGLMAIALFSTHANAQTKVPHSWGSYTVGEDEIKVPFQLKSQKLGH